MNNKRLLQVLILLLAFQGYTQSKKVADKYFEQFAYVKAAKLYEAIYQKGDSSKYILSRLGDSYYNNAETKEAEKWYKKLIKTYRVNDDYLFKYAQALRSNGKYKKSDSLLSTIDKESLLAINKETEFLLSEEKNKDNRISIRNLALNTPFSDFGGFVYNDEVYFASSSPTTTNKKKQKLYKWNNQPFLNIYRANSYVSRLEDTEKDSVFELEQKKILPAPVNTQYHESNAIITKDGKTMYFTRVNSSDGKRTRKDRKNTINLKLFKAKFKDGKWSDVTELPFNSDEYSVGHPALSPDEKTLYFTSDMPGTLGSTDIFKVSVKGDTYGKPVNLGSVVNTSNKEMFPFIGADNTLYFSSNGHLGLGLLDIFQTKLNEDGTYSEITNLGYPFNSERDDFSFYMDEKGSKGFFSSNRKNGKGDDDIYSFIIYKEEKKKVCSQIIAGVVKDSRTQEPVPLATVKLVDSRGEVIREALSDDKGEYRIENIPCFNKKYIVNGTKLDYKPDSKMVVSTKENGKEIQVDLTLKPLIIGNQIVISPIYFDFNKSNIREDAQYELEDIVTVMDNNPDMVIKIESHTDSRGGKDYNRKLSDRRAKSTRNYIISRGISPDRIESAIGYGEDQLLNHCDDARQRKCTEEEHQLNRRSYFYIVEGGKNVNVENKKPKVIDKSFKSRQRLIRKKSSSSDNLLKLLNSFKKEKAMNRKKNKCKKTESCS